MTKRLTKSRDSGVAEYFDVDPTIVRVGIVVLCLIFVPIVLIAYGVLAILMPSADEKPATDDPVDESKDTTPNHRHNLFAWALIGSGLIIVVSRLGFPHPGNLHKM